ncbi:MAG TPA: hypothetical protein EYP53_04605 [Candidatus Latescibacteria bacterium]|nr:hypothetical protein [Candidatus Latescibacterota bacterium]
MKTAWIMTLVCLMLAVGCQEKAEGPKPMGSLEFTVEPDTLVIPLGPGDYTISVKAKETGGVAVDLTSATASIVFLDGAHIMIGEQDLTVTQLTWAAQTPEQGGPVAPLLEQFWHFEAGEEKPPFDLPIKIGAEPTAPEGFTGLYLSSLYLGMATAQGKTGFKVEVTYEAADASGNLITGSFFLGIRVQET